jgi:organic radical activating enzyme
VSQMIYIEKVILKTGSDMLTLPFLELMVIRACNLSCTGCTTFSDLRHSGYVTWDQGHSELEPWIRRLNLEGIGIMGGEPLINPDLADWLIGIRKLLPNAQIRFVTNGLLLDQNWHIFELLRDLENTVFKISHHVSNDRLDNAIDSIMSSCNWEPVEEFGISRWKDPNRDFRFQIATPTQFLKTFRNTYEDMAPHDNMPEQAFELCVQKRCPLLWQGKLFKCGTLALTPDLLERYNWPNHDQWIPYLDSGLESTCSDQELGRFVNNFGKPNAKCRQCPSRADLQSLVDHRSTVAFK